VNREYRKWHSPALNREMELLVFGHRGPRMLVFPSRQQRFFEYEDRGMIHSLRAPLEDGRLQIICVDGIDEESFYAFEKCQRSPKVHHRWSKLAGSKCTTFWG
jgi:esterase/lipase superfamily enzyme